MPKGYEEGLATGASIAINGLCLTVVGWDDQGVQFDVIDESLRLSNLSDLREGSLVNIKGVLLSLAMKSVGMSCQATFMDWPR